MSARVVHILVLLVFLAGTQALAMPMPAMANGDVAGTAAIMSSNDCSACGKMDMTGGACGAICAPAPVVDLEAALSDPVGIAAYWNWHDDTLIDRVLSPDTAPPRRL